MSDATEQTQFDIVVVGGGIVGLSMALLLAQQEMGWRVLVLEARSGHPNNDNEPFDARTTALSSHSRNLFEALGLWPAMQKYASHIHSIHVSDRGHVGMARLHAADASVDALGFVMENHIMVDALGQSLVGVKIPIFWSTTVSAVTLGIDGVTLNLGHKQPHVSAKLLVVADGGASETAAKLGIHTANDDLEQKALVANIGLAKTHAGIAYERFTAAGPLALLPLTACAGSPRAALVWTQATARIDALMQLEDVDFIGALQEEFGYRCGVFKSVGMRACYPINTSVAEEQIRHRVVLVGNSAHHLHPVAGQGLNLALRDVASLAERLARARTEGLDYASVKVLEQYRKSRFEDQRRVIGFTQHVPKLFANRSPVWITGRNTGLLALDLMAPMRRRFMQFGMVGQPSSERHV